MIEPRKGDSLMVAHARRELEMAGAFDDAEGYDGGIGRAILAVVKTYSEKTQSKTSWMQIVHQSFNSLIAGELLAPPTTDPDEWTRVNREDGKDVMRNLRSPFYVSTDGLKSWTNTVTKERGACRDHVTGEMLEDPNATQDQGTTTADDTEAAPIVPSPEGEATVQSEPQPTDQPGSEAAQPTGDTEPEQAGTPADGGDAPAPRQRRNNAVDPQSPKGTGKPKGRAAKPSDRKAS